MITAIHLENFKAYGARTTIPIKPLTFLCGPNNGGKSSITQAIAIAADILNKGYFDGHRLESDGGVRDFGGFEQLRHAGPQEASPRIGFSLQLEGELPIDRYDVSDDLGHHVVDLAGRINQSDVWLDVATWELEVSLDGHRICRFNQAAPGVWPSFVFDVEHLPGVLFSEDLLREFEPAMLRPLVRQLGPRIGVADLLDLPLQAYSVATHSIGESAGDGTERVAERASSRLRTLREFRAAIATRARGQVGWQALDERLKEWIGVWRDVKRLSVRPGQRPSRRKDASRQGPESARESREALAAAIRRAHDFEVSRCQSDWDDAGEPASKFDGLVSWILNGCLGLSPDLAVPTSLEGGVEQTFRLRRGMLTSPPTPGDAHQVRGAMGRPEKLGPERPDAARDDRMLLEAMIDLVSLAPCRHLRSLIGQGVFVGPIRSILHDDVPSRAASNWCDGTRGWSEFVRREFDTTEGGQANSWSARRERQDQLQATVNRYCGSEYLDTGFAIREVHVEERAFSEDRQTGRVKYEVTSPESRRRRAYVRAVPISDEKSKKSFRASTLSNVGAGLSQVLPCLVALQHARRHLVSLEEPEIHLNPKQAVAFGDVLLHAVFGITPESVGESRSGEGLQWVAVGEGIVFVETHSDAMMLRVLARARQHAAAVGGAGGPQIHDHIGVVYVDQRSSEFRGRPGLLSVTREGRWSSPWPDDFFRVSAMERVR